MKNNLKNPCRSTSNSMGKQGKQSMTRLLSYKVLKSPTYTFVVCDCKRSLIIKSSWYTFERKKYICITKRSFLWLMRACVTLMFLFLYFSLSFFPFPTISPIQSPQHIVRLPSSNVPISLLFIHSLLFQPSSTVAILNSLAIHFCPTFSPYITFTK